MIIRNQIMAGIAVFAMIGTALAEDLQISIARPWQEAMDNGQKCYTLDYPGQGYPMLSFSPAIKPDSYYQVNWKMKSSMEEKEAKFALAIELSGRRANQNYVLTKDWSNYAGYFYSGKADTVKLCLYINPGMAGTIAVKDVKLTPVPPEIFTQNLLPAGNFEASNGIPANWSKQSGSVSAVIADSQGFISGEKSMEVNFDLAGSIIKSIQLPVVPGKEFELKFWAKAETDYVISGGFQAWSPFGHKDKHFYKFGKFKVSPEWKEYSIKGLIPADVTQYPDLQDGLIFIYFNGTKGQAGKVWFDDIAFRQADKAKRSHNCVFFRRNEKMRFYGQEAPEQFKDGQNAVFFGDSITHGGWYQYYIQLFYATRFPDRKIQIENAGVAGGSAAGSLDRLSQDVLIRKPDWVYIMFGMNDVGRGDYKTALADEKTMAARDGNLKTYKSSMAAMIEKIKASGVTPVVVTPSAYDQYGQNIQTENLAACNDGLAKCAEIARTIATENKCPVVDIHASVTGLMVKNPESRLAGNDRVHPDQTGHMVMAYYILQAQEVPELVSKMVIDCAKRNVERVEKCSVENLEFEEGSARFTYTPESLPFPVSDEYSKANKIIHWESLNQEIIQVKNLAAGDYKLLTGGKEAGCFSAARLASGINIATLPTPQQRRSAQIRNAVIAKADADRPLRGLVQVNCILRSAGIDPVDIVSSDKYLDKWLAKVIEQYKEYYTGVIKSYRENRSKFSELAEKAAGLQKKIFKLQKTESYLIEIRRSTTGKQK